MDLRYERVKSLFLAACDFAPERRRQFLAEQCADDADLRRDVESLLQHYDTGVITRSLDAPPPLIESSPDATTGLPQRIGHYRIIRLIGAGGMGVVYEAEQDQPRRTVALKLINPGLMTTQRIRRFQHEAEVLGRLQHPGIAQIFEAGMFDSPGGVQPFFAMELIRGEPLTAFAETRRLSTRQRLELMVHICAAVQHAHARGVIHRDLKPSNILVDDSGNPKILDFGIARVTDSDIQTTTLRTDIGQLIGTIPYMSPEQAAGDPANLDTRSDVYALGVIAYELLAGRLPYNLAQRMIHEAVRIIREDDPTPLSSIDKTFRGDVDLIISKALSKEKDRRYQSANEFASDIERYLHDEAIVARPASRWYRIRKFAQRHKALVGGTVATILMLIAGLVTALVLLGQAIEARRAEALQAQIARENEQKANSETQRALAAEQAAESEAAAARAVTAFIVQTLQSPDPARRGPNVTVAQVLRDGEGLIEPQFANMPRERMAVHQSYGEVFRALNLYGPGESHLNKAVELARSQFAADDPRLARVLNALGVVRLDLGQTAAAVECFAEAQRIVGAGDGTTLRDAAEFNLSMGGALHDCGDYDWAEFQYANGLLLYRTIDPQNADTARAMDLLARLKLDALDVAEPLVRGGFEIKQRIFAPNHPSTAMSLLTIGLLEHTRGDLPAAVTAYRDARDMYARLHDGESAFMVIVARMDLAGVLQDAVVMGQDIPHDPAETAWSNAELGDPQWIAAISLRNRGRLLHVHGHPDVGDDRFRQSLAIDKWPDQTTRAVFEAHTRRVWAARLVAAGQFERAVEQLDLAIALQRANLGGALQGAIASTLHDAGMLRLRMTRPDEAEPLLREALEIRRTTLSAEVWPSAVIEFSLARCRHQQGHADEARALAEHALGVLQTAFGTHDQRVLGISQFLADPDQDANGNQPDPQIKPDS